MKYKIEIEVEIPIKTSSDKVKTWFEKRYIEMASLKSDDPLQWTYIDDLKHTVKVSEL